MFSSSIRGCSLQEIPKQIKKEFILLSELKKTITTSGRWEGFPKYFEQVNEGFNCLKSRWLEYAVKPESPPKMISKRGNLLEDCAAIINVLRVLSSLREEKIKLLDTPKDVLFFEDEREKQLVIQAAVERLERNGTNRKKWLTQAYGNGLGLCFCSSSSKYRAKHEKVFLEALIRRYPPHPSFELCIMSLGSGELGQDWLLLQQLVLAGYSKLHLHFVDPRTTEATVGFFKSLISEFLDPSINVEIVHSQVCLDPTGVEECRSFHAIHALDFDSVLFFPTSEESWRALSVASDCLQEYGLLFCSSYGNKFWFDAQKGSWKLPDRVERLPGRIEKIDLSSIEPGDKETPIMFATRGVEPFWWETFYHLSQLKELGRDIIIRVVGEAQNEDVLSKICGLANKILAPNGEIEIKLENEEEKGSVIYDFCESGCMNTLDFGEIQNSIFSIE